MLWEELWAHTFQEQLSSQNPWLSLRQVVTVLWDSLHKDGVSTRTPLLLGSMLQDSDE